MHIKDLSIKRKLIAIQLLTVFIVLVFFCVFVISSDLHALRKSIISQLTSMAQLIGANSVSALNFLDGEAAGEILSSLEAEAEIVNAWIHNADGVLFAKYSKDGYTSFSFPGLAKETYVFHSDYTTLTKRIIQEGETIGTISLRSSMAQSRTLVRQKIMITLLVLIFGMIFALILSHMTQRTISGPVLKLVGISKKVSEIDDYSVRIEKEANDEIGILCDTYNDMMAQIGKRSAERDKAEETLKRKNEQLQKEIHERKQMEEELAKHRNHLEDLVETRTIELTNTNKQLQQEINDRKQAEKALRKSEASLANAQRIAHLGNWDWDIKRNELHWSDEIFRIFGLNPQEFGATYDAFMNSVHPDDRELVNKSVDEALHQKMPYSIDHRIVRPDGSELIVHEHAEVFFDVTGHPVRMSGTIQDVTEDKEAEEKLMLYRKIFSNSKDSIIIMDSDGKLIERNPAHQFLSRYEDDDLLGKTVAPFTGEETFQHFISELRENRIYRGEFLAHRKDGSPIHIDLSAFSIEHDNGELVCFVGISRDITERKNVEKALATRLRYEEGLAACSRTLLTEARTEDAINEALHFLLKAANTSRVYIFENFDDDSDGLCMRQIHEVCAEGVEPQIDDPLLQHAPYQLGFHRWRETLSRGEPINGLLETFPDSEQEIWVPQGNLSMLVIPIMVERDWYGFIGFDDVWEKREWSNEDISALQTASEMIGIYIERKKFDEMLRVSEERFRSLVENANDIIYSLSPKGEITYISPKFTDIMGYKVTEFLGNSFFPFIHPDDAKDSIEWFRSIMKDKPRKTGYEYRFKHKDGSIRWMAGHSSVIRDEDGNIFEIIGVAHDFTKMRNVMEDLEDANRHLRETQSQLVQSAKMASLGQLVAGIAHEINTPIGAVNSMQDTLFRTLENLKKTIKTDFPKEYEKQPRFKSALTIMDDSKKVIQSGTERVINIVRRLRSFARLDQADLKTVDIHEGIEDTLTLIRHEIKHNITVKKNYGKIPSIACYPGKLNQVFLNILVNAKQAIENTGEIEINTFTKQKKVYIEIKDNGKGITQKNLKKVFDPGFTTKGVGVGTGLGLSICYQIIQDHRGDLKAKSTQGEGTTFTIIIPMNLNEILTENQTEAKV